MVVRKRELKMKSAVALFLVLTLTYCLAATNGLTRQRLSSPRAAYSILKETRFKPDQVYICIKSQEEAENRCGISKWANDLYGQGLGDWLRMGSDELNLRGGVFRSSFSPRTTARHEATIRMIECDNLVKVVDRCVSGPEIMPPAMLIQACATSTAKCDELIAANIKLSSRKT